MTILVKNTPNLTQLLSELKTWKCRSSGYGFQFAFVKNWEPFPSLRLNLLIFFISAGDHGSDHVTAPVYKYHFFENFENF